jgi:hypothetical protein
MTIRVGSAAVEFALEDTAPSIGWSTTGAKSF